MTPISKPLPPEASQYASLIFFREQAQSRLNKISKIVGKESPQIQAEDIKVENQKLGDGQFSLVYENPKLDIVIRGLVLTNSHEMHLAYQRKSNPEIQSNFDYLEMKDSCSLTKAAVGAEELAQKDCQDGVVSPKLIELKDRYKSITAFDQFCQGAYGKYLQENPGLPQKGGYHLNRTQIFNPEKGNFAYSLLYENPANGFYCRGNISTKGFQKMFLSSGDRSEWKEFNGAHLVYEELLTKPPTVYEMTDACRLTKDLVGEEEYHNQCKEFTPGERDGVKVVDTIGKGVETAFLISGIYELGSGATWLYDKAFKTAHHAKSFGKWGSPTRGIWRGIRWTGSKAFNGGRAVLTRGLSLASRLRNIPTLIRGTRLALAGGGTVSTTTAATSTAAEITLVEGAGVTAGTGATAGVGAQIGVGLAGFAVGFGAGIGLEKLQQGIFGNSLSGLAGDGAYWAFGPADQSTIEWWDEYMGWLP